MSWTQPAFAAVAELVNRRTGLAFQARQESAELGMRRAMLRAKVGDPARYLDLVAGDHRALDDLVDELTVGETFFFREPAQFQVLRRLVLQDIRARRGPGHVVRVWSAGCASGEEAYSLAILFDQEGAQAQILATDISSRALVKARKAIYGEWSLRGESAQAAVPYLSLLGKQYHLLDRICNKVAFEYLNLALDVYPSLATGAWGMDLILCRNVLIYFDPATVRGVAQRLYHTLADGGWLLTASSDPPLWDLAPFEVEATEEGVFYRRPGACLKTREPAAPALAPEPETAWADTPVFDASTPVAAPLGETAQGAGDVHEAARQALGRGDYERVLALIEASDLRHVDSGLVAIQVRALANRDLARSEQVCAEALERFPLDAELHYLHAVLLVDAGRIPEAIRATRHVLYLDRRLAIAHFTLGALLRRQGDLTGARRSYRNARDLCAALPAEAVLPLADGEAAGRLAEAASFELSLLGSGPGES